MEIHHPVASSRLRVSWRACFLRIAIAMSFHILPNEAQHTSSQPPSTMNVKSRLTVVVIAVASIVASADYRDWRTAHCSRSRMCTRNPKLTGRANLGCYHILYWGDKISTYDKYESCCNYHCNYYDSYD